MFERRLKILLVLLAVPAVAIVLRLAQLQIFLADDYQRVGNRMLLRPVRYFPFLRGEIQDHEGHRLAFDAPAWDICVRYEIIAEDARYLRSLARRLPPGSEPIEAQVRASWQAISDLTGTPMETLRERQEYIRRRVMQIKEAVSNAQGIEVVVAEELAAHPVVRGLDQNQQAAARVALAAYPWVEVIAGHRRQYASHPSLGHLLGFLNEVDGDDIRNDPRREDDLARYRAGDLHGAAGVEAMAEDWLRGRRGMQQEDLEGRPSREPVEPMNGHNFRLTIDLNLQKAVYDKLEAAVAANPSSTGASAVVLDIPSRQVLALVSYPGFDANLSPNERLRLAADEMHRPLKFRAVAENYPPGSIVKPMILAGAWSDGQAGPGTHVFCQGQLNPNPPHFKCTGHHGDVDPVHSIQYSCNIFYYRMGESLGIPRLTHWLGLAGLGRPTGIGLFEEVSGSLPTHGNRGEARLTAIGQWNVMATPLQAANLVATVASGAWRPVTLWADDPREREPVPLPVKPEAWRTVREGMYRVVNEPRGTAHQHIHLQNTGDLVLLGKTGSAETQLGPVVEWIYVCRMPDGSEDELLAANQIDLLLKHPELAPEDILSRRPFRRWPTEEMDPTHAWFAGYLTSRSRYLESSAGGRLNVALVVLIEFGGRGGGVAAPVAGEIVQTMIDMQNGAAQPDLAARFQRSSGRRGQP